MNEIQEMSFIPRDLVTVMVGRHSTTCYPKVEAKIPVHERAFAYQVAKSALESLLVDIRLIIEAMATQLNCNTHRLSNIARCSVSALYGDRLHSFANGNVRLTVR